MSDGALQLRMSLLIAVIELYRSYCNNFESTFQTAQNPAADCEIWLDPKGAFPFLCAIAIARLKFPDTSAKFTVPQIIFPVNLSREMLEKCLRHSGFRLR
jgi:hypothetical protein